MPNNNLLKQITIFKNSSSTHTPFLFSSPLLDIFFFRNHGTASQNMKCVFIQVSVICCSVNLWQRSIKKNKKNIPLVRDTFAPGRLAPFDSLSLKLIWSWDRLEPFDSFGPRIPLVPGQPDQLDSFGPRIPLVHDSFGPGTPLTNLTPLVPEIIWS